MASCNGSNNSKTELSHHLTIEQKAVNFFVDSLLYKPVQLGEKNNEVYLPPLFDKWLYKEGLFKGIDLYSNSEFEGVTKPYIDSISYAIAIEEHTNKISGFEEMWTTYDSLIKYPARIHIDFPTFIKLTEYKNFQNMNDSTSMYMRVYKYLPVTNGYYVQIEFTHIISGVEFPYSLYVFMDRGKKIRNYFWN